MIKQTDQARRAAAVQIAQDVLQQLDAGQLRLTSAYFFSPDDNAKDDLIVVSLHGALQPWVDYVQQRCRVCARGALLLSFARCFNRVTCAELIPALASAKLAALLTRGVLSQVLGDHEIINLESVFGVGSHSSLLGMDTLSPCQQFAVRAVKTPGTPQEEGEQRLRAICENIIQHDGQFVLEPKE